jgi:hypothetical protein
MKLTLLFKGLMIVALVPLASAATTPQAIDASASIHAKSATKAKPKAFKTLPQKKSGSGVRVQYQLDSTPQVGKPLVITLQFNKVVDAKGAKSELSADSALLMQNNVKSIGLIAKQTTAHQLIVTPQAEGLFYVNVFTEQDGRKSAAAIPVQVGAGTPIMKTIGTLKTDSNGEKVISMPAQ